MNMIWILAQTEADRWLDNNPHILGLLAILIGLALGGSGAYELHKGKAHDKYGNEIPGGLGQFTSILRIVIGIAACLFGLYKLAAG